MMSDQVAWYVCRYRGITDDVALPIRDGADISGVDFTKRGRMTAARQFKRWHELHPCVKVDVEFQMVMPAAEYRAA